MNILAIGSSVVDLFLSVDPHHVTIADTKVLFSLGDKIPADIKTFAIGGNGANVSVGLTRLGIPATFYTYLGRDVLSREIEEKLTQEGVEVIANRHGGGAPLHIIMNFDTDRIIFSHYEKHTHTFTYTKTPLFDYIYLTSLADIWTQAYQQILEFSLKNTIPIAFSPGSRQLDEINDLFYSIMKQTSIFFANRDEAAKILGSSAHEINSLLIGIQKLGPSLVSITDGKNGAYALNEKGQIYTIGTLDIQSHERTGAGDAYASGFLAAFLEKKSITESMRWGVLNASGVMQKTGAQSGLLGKKEMKEWSEKYSDLRTKRVE